jgi:hypothetical protein
MIAEYSPSGMSEFISCGSSVGVNPPSNALRDLDIIYFLYLFN